MKNTIAEPRNLRLELEAIEVKIKRDEKQKFKQPLNKKMTSDAYIAYVARQKTT